MNIKQALRYDTTDLGEKEYTKAKELFQKAIKVSDFKNAAELSKIAKNHYWSWQVRRGVENKLFKTKEDAEVFIDLCKFDSHVDFEAYCIYLEYKRPLENQFFLPRRRAFEDVIIDLQDLKDFNIHYYGLSMPAGTGKSTLALMFMSMQMGLYPDEPNLITAYGDNLTEQFYLEMKNLLVDTDTYAWHEIFTGYDIIDRGTKKQALDVRKEGTEIANRRYATMKGASIGGSLTGSARVGKCGVLYSDDLVKDLEEALSPQRLKQKFNQYMNVAKDRTKDGYRELMIGTRWNLHDPIGVIQDKHVNDTRYRFRAIPALNDNGESNFDYNPSPEGFSTQYYIDLKADLEDNDWAAKYMQKPYDRIGALFPPDSLKYYKELPDGDYRVQYFCDIAWGGDDALAGVFLYITGENEDMQIYVEDVIYNKGDKTVTMPLTVAKIMQHKPFSCFWEHKKDGTASYPETIGKMLLEHGFHTDIRGGMGKSPTGSANKMARIVQYSSDIKKWHFKDIGYRHNEYNQFLANVYEYSTEKPPKHEDAPDVCAHACERIFKPKNKKRFARIGKRFF